MTTDPFRTAALALALTLFAATPSLGQDKAKASAEPGAKPATVVPKPAAAAKLVDLNSAGKAELKQVPGFSDALADRIIAARPFRTKAELVTRNLIPEDHYWKIRKQVEVRNPPMPKLPGTSK